MLTYYTNNCIPSQSEHVFILVLRYIFKKLHTYQKTVLLKKKRVIFGEDLCGERYSEYSLISVNKYQLLTKKSETYQRLPKNKTRSLTVVRAQVRGI